MGRGESGPRENWDSGRGDSGPRRLYVELSKLAVVLYDGLGGIWGRSSPPWLSEGLLMTGFLLGTLIVNWAFLTRRGSSGVSTGDVGGVGSGLRAM